LKRVAIACILILSGAAMAGPVIVDPATINAAIKKACKLPAGKAHFYREGSLDHLKMAPNSNYTQIKCASQAASAAGARLPRAFVGKIS